MVEGRQRWRKCLTGVPGLAAAALLVSASGAQPSRPEAALFGRRGKCARTPSPRSGWVRPPPPAEVHVGGPGFGFIAARSDLWDVSALAGSTPCPSISEGVPRVTGRWFRPRVTDPSSEQRSLARPDRGYRVGECLRTVGLGEPFDGVSDRLTAAVFSRERGERP